MGNRVYGVRAPYLKIFVIVIINLNGTELRYFIHLLLCFTFVY